MIATVLAFLQRWAAYIWTVESVYGLLVCWKLLQWVNASLKGEMPPAVREGLAYLSRLAWTAIATLVALVFVGVASYVSTAAWVQLATLGVLLLVPNAFTWIVYRAFALRGSGT